MTATGTDPRAIDVHPRRAGVMLLLQAALAFFVFAIVVGILNGTDAVDFGHETLMTHVHAGTLGWITLAVLAASIWLFWSDTTGWAGTLPRVLPAVAIVAIGAYLVAFFTTTGTARPVAGGAALAVLVVAFVWVVAQARRLPLSTPRLGVLAAIATSVIGGTLGVLLGLEIAGDSEFLPDGAYDAHPATMVVGFLVPIGMAITEWHLDPAGVDQPAGRAGQVQVAALFVGGVVLMAGALADQPALIGLNLPFELIAVGVFLRRMAPSLRRVDWRAGYRRGFALSAVSLVLDIALLVFLVARYQGDLDDAPNRLILALDHLMFIGVMTNALFGLLDLAAGTPEPTPMDQAIVVGTNVGLVVFALGLLADAVWLKRVGTPVMGTALLVAVGAFTYRLRRATTARLGVA